VTFAERKPRHHGKDVSEHDEPGNRDTKKWHQQLNDFVEAYTGNDAGHREDRNFLKI
jgi:hypothetical protein